MSTIFRGETLTQVNRIAGLEGGISPPLSLDNKVVPVIEVSPIKNRRCDWIKGSAQNATGNITVATIEDAPYQVCLTGCAISYAKDNLCDIATGDLNLTIVLLGQTTAINLISIAVLTLTAQSETVVIQFKDPILLKPSSTIVLSGAFGAGSMRRACRCFGYYSDKEGLL